ncbi:MAG: VWA domain-containing protein [Acidobacteriota bacterium]
MRAKGYSRNQVIQRGWALLALLGVVGWTLLTVTPFQAQSGRRVTRPRVVSPRPAEPSPTSEEPIPEEDVAPSTSRTRPTLGRRGEDAPQPSLPPPTTNADDDIITIQATLVTIPVVVSDDYNRYLPFLQKNAFSLFEDNVLQEITFFTSEQVPFHVALVIDVSRSAYLSIDDMCSAANAFIDYIRPDDKVSVFTFSDKIRQLCPFTSNQMILRQAVARAKIESGTRLYDAAYQILSTYLAPIEGRKAMILLTDGEDTTSRHYKPREILDRVAESDALVYTVQYPSADPNQIRPSMPFPFPFPFPVPRRRPRQGPFLPLADPPQRGGISRQEPSVFGLEETFLRDIATISGGMHNPFTDIGTARKIFRNIAEELRHVYVLGYYPTRGLDQPGYRRVRVRVNHPEARVRARPGYIVTEEMARRDATPVPTNARD